VDATHHFVSPHFGQACAAAIGGAGDSFPGGHSGREPPDPIPNSEVKTLCADGSLAVGQVRVGHCQDPMRTPRRRRRGVYFWPAVDQLRMRQIAVTTGVTRTLSEFTR
jgi:hypothetical protein